jgi:hypothetical protein
MSDLNKLGQKVVEGTEWRGTITVEVDDEEVELKVRQLNDGEFREVMSLIDRDELEELRSDIEDEKMERYRELTEMEELDEDESDELSELQAELNEATGNLFDALGEDTFNGIQKCAKYCVVPDEEDLMEVFENEAHTVEKEYGIKVEKPEDVEPFVEDKIGEWVENATNMVSFRIGMKALVETVGDEKN